MFPAGSMYPTDMFTPGMYSPEMYPPDMYAAETVPTETPETTGPSPMESRQDLINKIETLRESKLVSHLAAHLYKIMDEPYSTQDDKKVSAVPSIYFS